jgi:hypothetical protein
LAAAINLLKEKDFGLPSLVDASTARASVEERLGTSPRAANMARRSRRVSSDDMRGLYSDGDRPLVAGCCRIEARRAHT